MSDLGDRKILIDEPISNGALDFPKYSKAFAEIITKSKPKFSIGIFGDWGTGKTTLMLMIRNFLVKEGASKDDQKIVTVWFDAWRYEKEQYLAAVPLIRTIALALEDIDKSKMKRWELVKKGAQRTLTALLQSSKFKFGLGIGEIELDGQKMIDSYKGDDNSIYYHASEFLEESLKKLREKDKDRDFRIVVFIDDLDRCRPAKALEILESIKSLFDIPGIIYVIGMSHKSLDLAIKQKYGDSIRSRDYMKKLIQLQFEITDWFHKDILKFMENSLFKIKKHNESTLLTDLNKHKRIIMLATEKNPREVKRFINSIILTNAVFNKPIENLIVYQALRFHPDWKNFSDFMMMDKKKIEFLTLYKGLDKDQSVKEKILKIYPEIKNEYPSFFERPRDPLRRFIDETINILENLDMEEYRRYSDTTGIGE